MLNRWLIRKPFLYPGKQLVVDTVIGQWAWDMTAKPDLSDFTKLRKAIYIFHLRKTQQTVIKELVYTHRDHIGIDSPGFFIKLPGGCFQSCFARFDMSAGQFPGIPCIMAAEDPLSPVTGTDDCVLE